MWGILCTVLCCLPLGIVSIVYASKVSGLWAQGRYAEAQEASANAKKWAIWGAVAAVAASGCAIIWVANPTVPGGILPVCPTRRYSASTVPAAAVCG